MTTLFSRLWDSHRVASRADGCDLLYVDRHVLHEVTSAQAFDQLQMAGRRVRAPGRHIAVPDHSVPTLQGPSVSGGEAVDTLAANAAAAGIPYFPLHSSRHGIVHVTAPEQGFVVPGCTVVCGDSHTATLGAFGALAFGIGTSEVEHVLATQSLWVRRPRTLGIEVTGSLGQAVYAKDLALHIIAKIGTAGAVGCAIEYFGSTVRALTMEGRMTLCNMSIEAGGRFGMVAPDEVTVSWLREHAAGLRNVASESVTQTWLSLKTDSWHHFDARVRIDGSAIEPTLTWGTTPADATTISGRAGDPDTADSRAERDRIQAALDYMGLKAGQAVQGVPIDVAFIGSCTNSRIEDLRAAAAIVAGRRVARNVRALVVPGSAAVKHQAEKEGLADIFVGAGFEWRGPGCSMCVAMNGDHLQPGQRCASSSNRNFENRQGSGGRTHLLSPAAVAASAIAGYLTDPREFLHA
ncbi:3-isopropylmalate dehydratase large subunit [Cupriavidus pinatubonensis]|uniref:3-isopropylmalate dehydratase large subunit n=1 Tax=Cupriavidus pinatubonensis TaxID=248026 RepID=UPI00112E7298|nr:3-isopropylmalate dehydratase large subunit [Cupriavidus pinatubonensis]TPQ43535.1 3-isopropylmalate dehydratase large subunit [Cupriavidus pinatubonensis]